MAKVKVEIEVSNDVFHPCETCRYYRQDRFDWGYCYLFEQKISYGHRCKECKKAEAEMNTNENKYYNLLNDIYRKFDTGEYVKIPSMRKIGDNKWVVYFYENGLIHNGIYYTEERARRKLEQVNGG